MSQSGITARFNFLRRRSKADLELACVHRAFEDLRGDFNKAWAGVGQAVIRVAASLGAVKLLRDQAADAVQSPIAKARAVADYYSEFVVGFSCEERHDRYARQLQDGIKSIDANIHQLEVMGAYDPDGKFGNAMADAVVVLANINATNRAFLEKIDGHND